MAEIASGTAEFIVTESFCGTADLTTLTLIPLPLQTTVVTTTFLITLTTKAIATYFSVLAAVAVTTEVVTRAAMVITAHVWLLAELASLGVAAVVVVRGADWATGYTMLCRAALRSAVLLRAAGLGVAAELVVLHAGPIITAVPIVRTTVCAGTLCPTPDFAGTFIGQQGARWVKIGWTSATANGNNVC
jgi:hypothetical protein